MTKEMEYAKCIAVIGMMLRLELISEKEYGDIKSRLMNQYMILNTIDGPAA